MAGVAWKMVLLCVAQRPEQPPSKAERGGPTAGRLETELAPMRAHGDLTARRRLGYLP